MDNNTFDILYNDVQKALIRRRLSDALASLKGLTARNTWGLTTRWEQLQADFDRMLSYWEQGLSDPSRETLYLQFLAQASELAETARYHYLIDTDTSHLSRLRQRINTETQSTESAFTSDTIFNRIYTDPPFSSADYERLKKDICDDSDNPLHTQLLAVSAITLSGLHIFDARRLQLLLDIAGNEALPTQLQARAIVGAVLILLQYREHLPLYPTLPAQLQILTEQPSFVTALQMVQLQFLLSLRTKQDIRKMDEEILPEMMRAAQRIKPLQEMDFSRIAEIEMELNPEWDAHGKPSRIRQRINELMALQEKGVDTFYTTFSHVMRQQAFWEEISHWFTPFTLSHPVFQPQNKQLSHLKLLFDARPASDTERYAITFMFMHLADTQLQGLGDSLQKMEELHGDLLKEFRGEDNHSARSSENGDPHATMRQAIRFYVQDLYRFFYLYRHQDKHTQNPFQQSLDLSLIPPFLQVMQHTDSLLAFASFCFSEASWNEASYYYQLLPEQEKDAEIYEKMGYCAYMKKDYPLAAEYFERANIINPDSTWTLRQLAKVHILSRNYFEALRPLQELERRLPEDVDTLLRLGECHIHLGQSQEAFEKLHKADYLHPDGLARRALAWCSLLEGNVSQAEEHYTHILQNTSATSEDYYNAGHSAWLSGTIDKAVQRYVRSIQMHDERAAESDFFTPDRTMLKRLGVTETDLELMRETINRHLNKS